MKKILMMKVQTAVKTVQMKGMKKNYKQDCDNSASCAYRRHNSKSLQNLCWMKAMTFPARTTAGDQLPQICINDPLMVTSPPPISVTLNNNMEKTDKNSVAIKRTQSLQISPSLNIITSGNKLTGDGAQSISVKLGNLNGVQITCDHVTPSVLRAFTGSASC